MRQPDLHQDLYDYAIGKQASSRVENYHELIKLALTDKNYSFAKEIITCYLAGYAHNPNKHDLDGHKIVDGQQVFCEVKPTAYWGKVKLNMKCGFADFTASRLDEYTSKNPEVLVSGFDKHRLLYCIGFKFNCQPFRDKIAQDVDKITLLRSGRRCTPAPTIAQIRRIDPTEIKRYYRADDLDQYKHAISDGVYQLLLSL